MLARHPECLHCHARTRTERRRLCRTCARDPVIRERYPRLRCDPSEIADFSHTPPLPLPTKALPGTPEKFAVLCARAERGESLFSPLDARRAAGMTAWLGRLVAELTRGASA